MSNTVGDGIGAQRGNWKFSGEASANFDAHVSKSVPLYTEGHQLICDLSDFFIKPDSTIYEVGCSTGSLTLKLAQHNINKPDAQFIGVDIESDMIEVANKKALDHDDLNIEFLCEDMINVDMKKADMIICYYTIQFVRPSVRQDLINKLYQNLNWGGSLLLFEKVRGSDARFQDVLTALYTDYKLRTGYTPDDIITKSRSLKGVLEPFSSLANIEMLNRAGFSDINTIMKYLCFEGFLAIK
ncbi:MAG: methyltransferase [Cycloclasticus sp.]|nr:methyltransferase [Cycloclasticus sp.]MBG95260.1 methyltransferase [Cycloclasticus sp.]HAI96696.1 methyltransferase [Methylococcaceae bacterium]|tara:strand:+ start:267 stop:989 length:723 start_codon:yes stop_codon:yes gene_type:complete